MRTHCWLHWLQGQIWSDGTKQTGSHVSCEAPHCHSQIMQHHSWSIILTNNKGSLICLSFPSNAILRSENDCHHFQEWNKCFLNWPLNVQSSSRWLNTTTTCVWQSFHKCDLAPFSCTLLLIGGHQREIIISKSDSRVLITDYDPFKDYIVNVISVSGSTQSRPLLGRFKGAFRHLMLAYCYCVHSQRGYLLEYDYGVLLPYLLVVLSKSSVMYYSCCWYRPISVNDLFTAFPDNIVHFYCVTGYMRQHYKRVQPARKGAVRILWQCTPI